MREPKSLAPGETRVYTVEISISNAERSDA